MKSKTLVLVMLLAAASLNANAHAPKTGQNGGQQTDAGQYHVEALVSEKTLTLYIYDHNEKAVQTKGFKATAILVVDGKAERVTLLPEGDNKLLGTSSIDLKAPIKGAVQITNNVNGTVQAKF